MMIRWNGRSKKERPFVLVLVVVLVVVLVCNLWILWIECVSLSDLIGLLINRKSYTHTHLLFVGFNALCTRRHRLSITYITIYNKRQGKSKNPTQTDQQKLQKKKKQQQIEWKTMTISRLKRTQRKFDHTLNVTNPKTRTTKTIQPHALFCTIFFLCVDKSQYATFDSVSWKWILNVKRARKRGNTKYNWNSSTPVLSYFSFLSFIHSIAEQMVEQLVNSFVCFSFCFRLVTISNRKAQ